MTGTVFRTKSTKALACAVSSSLRATLVTLGMPIQALSLVSHDFENPTSRVGSARCWDLQDTATIWGKWLKKADGGPERTTNTMEYGSAASDSALSSWSFLVIEVKPMSTALATAGGGGTDWSASLSFWECFLF